MSKEFDKELKKRLKELEDYLDAGLLHKKSDIRAIMEVCLLVGRFSRDYMQAEIDQLKREVKRLESVGRHN
jgi:polyhydroxyalkanoate synthesis regulator phasin